MPKKASKYRGLNEREKAYNKRLARERVVIEHINAKIKTFKSMDIPTGIIAEGIYSGCLSFVALLTLNYVFRVLEQV
jgi:hypothetical protein